MHNHDMDLKKGFLLINSIVTVVVNIFLVKKQRHEHTHTHMYPSMTYWKR